MGDLMKYSAIATKLRAMESHLLKAEDYRRLAEAGSVPQAVAYLKRMRTSCTAGRLRGFWRGRCTMILRRSTASATGARKAS